jgi:copper resistance protein D
VGEALVFVRLVHFAALMAVFGSIAFRLYGFTGAARSSDPDAMGSFDRWLARIVLAGALAALGSGLLMVPCIAATMAGSGAAALQPPVLEAVLFATHFGRLWCGHVVLLLLLALAAAAAARRIAVVLSLALLGLASLGFVGHAADQGGWAGLAREVNQSLHLLAGGLWLGGLLPLGWLLRRAGRREGESCVALAREAVPPFSQMGYAAVAVIAITGAINTLLLVGSLGALFGTDYGRLLSLKILLYLAMVALALRNRLRLAPRISRSAPGMRALCRSVLIEQALGLGILAAVSLLGTWAPPAAGAI